MKKPSKESTSLVQWIRILPMLLALAVLLNIAFSNLEWKEPLYWLNRGYGVGILVLCPLFYKLSKVFKFCIYHRTLLNYVVICKCILIFDEKVGIPLGIRNLLIMYYAIAGVFLIVTVYQYLKYGDRKLE